MMDALSAWVKAEEGARGEKFRGYVHGISQARYVTRKVFRIVDEEAKRVGLDPLEHQALLQAFGAGSPSLTVSQLAERLDIAPAFGSRVVKDLVKKGLVERRGEAADRRVTRVEVTPAGEQLLRDIDRAVHVHVEYFQSQLTDDQREAALAIFAFYVGLGAPRRLEAIISSSKMNGDGP